MAVFILLLAVVVDKVRQPQIRFMALSILLLLAFIVAGSAVLLPPNIIQIGDN